MIVITDVVSVGQIKKGDFIYIESKNENVEEIHKVKEVIFENTHGEEILLKRKSNRYFITSKYLKGSSWVNSVKIISCDQR